MSDRFVKLAQLALHPERSLVHDLVFEDYEALRESIREKGVLQPLVLHENTILDGHHRHRAALEIGLTEVPAIRHVGLSADEEVETMLTLNGNRRQWTREQKRETAVKLRERGWTNVRVARSLGMSEGWVRAQFRNNTNLSPPTVEGTDGRQYPARKPRVPGIPRDPARKQRGHATVSIPGGKSPEDIVREYAPLRADGASVVDVATEAGVHAGSFGLMEKVVALADRADLSPPDRETADAALREMNETRQVRRVIERITPLLDRIYGLGRQPNLGRREAARVESFDRAFGALTQACSMASGLVVPYLSPDRASEVLGELEEAVKSVRTLMSRIRKEIAA